MTTTSGIRGRTRRAIYDFVRQQGMATKNDIAAALGISLPTVSKYLSHFRQTGLLREGAKLSSGAQGGRSPIAYTCVADGRLAVGVDVTRDHVTCLVVNLERNVSFERHTERDFERSESYFAFVGGQVEETVAAAGVDRDRILGVGVAVPGLISETTGRVTYGRVIDNYGITAADFGRHIAFPTRLVHDSDAAGLAEFWLARGVENAFYVSLSKSVGGSVLMTGGIYRGDGEYAGEIGHVTLHEGGLRCYCGQNGCVDPYCNADVLARHADGSLADFFDRLAQGDRDLAEVWDRYTSDLARAIHNIRVLFGCTVILGGDVGVHIHPHLGYLREKVDRLSFLSSNSELFLFSCDYTTYPVATGAALYLVDEFLQELGPAPQHPGTASGRALHRSGDLRPGALWSADRPTSDPALGAAGRAPATASPNTS